MNKKHAAKKNDFLSIVIPIECTHDRQAAREARKIIVGKN